MHKACNQGERLPTGAQHRVIKWTVGLCRAGEGGAGGHLIQLGRQESIPSKYYLSCTERRAEMPHNLGRDPFCLSGICQTSSQGRQNGKLTCSHLWALTVSPCLGQHSVASGPGLPSLRPGLQLLAFPLSLCHPPGTQPLYPWKHSLPSQCTLRSCPSLAC